MARRSLGRAPRAPRIAPGSVLDSALKPSVVWVHNVDATHRSDLHELAELQYARFEARLEQRIAELRSDVASVKSDLVKWMFAFWAPTALAVVALLLRK